MPLFIGPVAHVQKIAKGFHLHDSSIATYDITTRSHLRVVQINNTTAAIERIATED